MIIAFNSEDIPQSVYDEVSNAHISTLPVRIPKTLEDVILYTEVYAFNHSNGVFTTARMETPSYRITAIKQPKMHVKIEFLCIEEVSKIDSEIERLKKKKEDIIKKNRDVFRDMTLENLVNETGS